MVEDEENEPDSTEETSTEEESEESTSDSSSPGYSSSQYNPTSRGRPGASEGDTEEDDEETNESTPVDDPDSTTEVKETGENTTASPGGETDDGPTLEEDEMEDVDEEEDEVNDSPTLEEDDSDEGTFSEESDSPEEVDESAADVEDTGDVEEKPSDDSESMEPEAETREKTEEVKPSTEPASDSESGIYGELEEFRGFSIFEDLGPEAIKIVVDNSNRKTVGDGQTIFEEEDTPNNNFYLILEGEVRIMKFMRTETTQVTVLEDGDYFGEFGMFTGDDRMAGAEARGPTEILEIPKSALDNLRRTDSEALVQIYENMFQSMAKRFRALARKAEKSQFWL